MHGLTPDRRPRPGRRKQIRRRRAGALVIVATLSLLAVWLAYALPADTPARVPAAAAQPTFAEKASVDRRIVVATVGDVEILLPVALADTTAIGYHAADRAGSLPFSPRGERVSGGGLAQRLTDLFKSGGGLAYYLMGEGDDASATGALDIGAIPGAEIFSPVDGKVVAIESTLIADKYEDVEVQIQVADDPTLLLVVSHVVETAVQLGDGVTQGDTLLGRVREYPPSVEQELCRFTSDAGDHVQFVALRVSADALGL